MHDLREILEDRGRSQEELRRRTFQYFSGGSSRALDKAARSFANRRNRLPQRAHALDHLAALAAANPNGQVVDYDDALFQLDQQPLGRELVWGRPARQQSAHRLAAYASKRSALAAFVHLLFERGRPTVFRQGGAAVHHARPPHGLSVPTKSFARQLRAVATKFRLPVFFGPQLGRLMRVRASDSR